jgi:hypothetical protein
VRDWPAPQGGVGENISENRVIKVPRTLPLIRCPPAQKYSGRTKDGGHGVDISTARPKWRGTELPHKAEVEVEAGWEEKRSGSAGIKFPRMLPLLRCHVPTRNEKTRAGPLDGNLLCPEKMARDGPAHLAAIRRRWRRAGKGRGMKTLHFLPVPVLLESPCARSLRLS